MKIYEKDLIFRDVYNALSTAVNEALKVIFFEFTT